MRRRQRRKNAVEKNIVGNGRSASRDKRKRNDTYDTRDRSGLFQLKKYKFTMCFAKKTTFFLTF